MEVTVCSADNADLLFIQPVSRQSSGEHPWSWAPSLQAPSDHTTIFSYSSSSSIRFSSRR